MEDIKIVPKDIDSERNIEEKIDEYPPGGASGDVTMEINDAFPNIVVPDPVEDESMPIIDEKQFIQEDEVFSGVKMKLPVIKKVKVKRTMTPEALEKLKFAREKAIETRRKNKLLRESGEMKTKKQIQQEEKLQDIENRRPVVNNVVNKTENITNTITHDDIMKIATETTSKALLSYEEQRLVKKAEKKKKKEKDNQKAIVRDTILKATGRKYGEEGYFAGCF
tara:strand:+ start:2961 stop:3629 length:669 start_codon:yes stop_codon:yes gene_type:complete